MLQVELLAPGRTIPLPPLAPGAPPASLTDHRPEGAQILLVSCHADDAGARLEVSRGGVTVEQGDWRLVSSLDLVLERALASGESYERPFFTRRGRVTLRLRHVPGQGGLPREEPGWSGGPVP